MVKTNARAHKNSLTAPSHSLPSSTDARDPAPNKSRRGEEPLRRALPRKAKKDHSQLRQTAKRGAAITNAPKGGAAPVDRTARRIMKGARQADRQKRRNVAERIVARESTERKQRPTAAMSRMDAAKAELVLFDKVLEIPEFVSNPFLAIEGHLNDTMECLKPQTPDVGRLKL